MRILVTGSRDWSHASAIYGELSRHLDAERTLVVVQGACPTGADAYADDWAKCGVGRGFNVISEPHPADWTAFGKRAGFARNAEMVDLGADLCLAFIRDYSPGATNCANLAAAHGIPTRIFREDADGNYLGEDK